MIKCWDDFMNHKVLPKKMGDSKHVGTQISGTYNRLVAFNLEPYLPDWKSTNNPTKAGKTLTQYVDVKCEQLKGLIRTRPNLVGKKRGWNADKNNNND